MSKTLTEIEAAIRVRMSPTLLRWFTSYAPKFGNDRKLPFTKQNDEYFYDSDELDSFNEFLMQRWPCAPGQKRPPVPAGIEREIMIEANHKCAFCDYTAHGEGAHIDPVSKSGCNHPHNLIWACPNHHTEYDHGLKVKSVVKADHVRVMKELLQETQLRRWRIELRACSNLLAFIEELERVRSYLKDPRLLDIQKSLQTHTRDILKLLSDEAAKPVVAQSKDSPKPSEHYQGLVNHIAEIIPTRDTSSAEALDEVVEEVVEAREEYLEQDSLAKCPLCNGSGHHNRFRCPVCGGEGTVSAEVLPDIDLSPYEQKKCPLCKGSGSHNRFDCPVCSGVGTLDAEDCHDIDLSPYEQKKCPLCKGSGSHNRFDCPVCSGVGTLDAEDCHDIDLSPYEQKKCPLCKGSGSHNRFDCPVCSGVGTLDAEDFHDIDLAPYEQKKCPLCKGSGSHNHADCPVCSGVGTLDASDCEDIDLSPYEQVRCPLCKGTRRFKGDECPVCDGEGHVDSAYADDIDLDQFRE